MKLYIYILIILLPCAIFAQQGGAPVVEDIATPDLNGPKGNLQNTVSSATGKVNTSIPITNITARGISYPIVLNYNGENVFNQAQKQNQYEPTSILGVGWNLAIPKITADTKETGSREDDVFYLLDGTNNTKLICTKKTEPSSNETGPRIWEFRLEKHAPYKVQYYKTLKKDLNGAGSAIPLDYWVVTNDKGIKYYYGQNDNSREQLIAWGNWIGNSNNVNGAAQHTLAWNLFKIEDQWSNTIEFVYEKEEQKINSTGPKHTEASYIKEVRSSIGTKAVFDYKEKQNYEYYEPHIEKPEPDAYQERYEKKYLDNIKVYDRKGNLHITHDIGYLVSNETSTVNRKRYLTSITQTSKKGENLPSQEYEYHLSGDYKGGLKKIIYPTGGSVQYNFTKQLLFNNTASTSNVSNNYETIGRYTSNNYSLKLDVQGNYNFPDDFPLEGSKTVKLIRNVWNGNQWKQSEYILPKQVEFKKSGFINDFYMNNVKFTFGDDFYAMLIYNKQTGFGDMFIFHLNQDGVTWDEKTFSNIPLDASDGNEPTLMSGDEFIAFGTKGHGRLHKFYWTGRQWNYSITKLGQVCYYNAKNNFILVLDENGIADVVTGTQYSDKYYIHYLDAEKKWQTKSWSADIDPHIAPIDLPSFFYPSNSMTGFMADNNPEFFLRWDENYNLISVDKNVLGSYEDHFPLVPVGGGMFVLQRKWETASGQLTPLKIARFDGANWGISKGLDSRSLLAVSEDMILSREPVNGTHTHTLVKYNPNSNSQEWVQNTLDETNSNILQYTAYAMANDIFISGQAIYKKTNAGYEYLGDYNPYKYTQFAQTGGYDYLFAQFKESNNGDLYQANLFYLDKKEGTLENIILGEGNDISYHKFRNWGTANFGGNKPFFSSKTYVDSNGNFRRVIDNQINQSVYDIVVSSIFINNGANETRKTFYTYDDANPLPDDETVFYGKVTIENKGHGTSSNGKIINFLNNGEEDILLAGLPLIKETYDVNNNLVKKSTSIWSKFLKRINNSSNFEIGNSFYSRITNQEEELKFSGEVIKNTTTNSYSDLGLLESTEKRNSKNLIEKSTIKMAYEQYPFMQENNMISYPYEVQNEVDNRIESVSRTIWKNENGKTNIRENVSGQNPSFLRIDNRILSTDEMGNIQEISNSKGLHNTILYGYNRLHKIVSISNARFDDVINELDTNYDDLQTLTNEQLKIELNKLYDRLPNSMINISLFDDFGRIKTSIDERKQEVHYYYDSFGRLDYITDLNNKVLEKNIYNYKTD